MELVQIILDVMQIILCIAAIICAGVILAMPDNFMNAHKAFVRKRFGAALPIAFGLALMITTPVAALFLLHAEGTESLGLSCLIAAGLLGAVAFIDMLYFWIKHYRNRKGSK